MRGPLLRHDTPQPGGLVKIAASVVAAVEFGEHAMVVHVGEQLPIQRADAKKP